MAHEQAELAARIAAFELDEPESVDTFSRRLARDNGWSIGYTRRVVREYKRFLILAATADHVVVPSEQVDQAWHLHVLHAARYRAFCCDVLGRRLDHGPSHGGRAEHARFVRAYEQTLASYERCFGEVPASDVWPRASQRFGTDLAVVRVNTAEHWVLRKPRFWPWRHGRRSGSNRVTGGLALAAGMLSALVCGCGASLADHATGPDYLRGFLLLWLVTGAAAYLLKRAKGGRPSSAPPALEPYTLAQLAGGPSMALDSAITALIARGCVAHDDAKETLTAERPTPSTAPVFEQGVYGQLSKSGTLKVGELRRRATPLTLPLAEQLRSRGLVASGSKLPFVLALIAPVVGGFRILSRIGTDRPVSLLVMLTLLATVLAVWSFFPRRQRTELGEATLARAREAHEPLMHRENAAGLAEGGTLPVMLALFGTLAIVGLPEWTSSLNRRAFGDSSSACGADSGASCSGGGCSSDGGGGCGGCGGGCGGCSGGGD